MGEKYSRRLSIEVDEHRHLAMTRIFDFGIKHAVFIALIDEVLRIHKAHGNAGLVGILNHTIRLQPTEEFKKSGTTEEPKTFLLGVKLRGTTSSGEGEASSPQSE